MFILTPTDARTIGRTAIVEAFMSAPLPVKVRRVRPPATIAQAVVRCVMDANARPINARLTANLRT